MSRGDLAASALGSVGGDEQTLVTAAAAGDSGSFTVLYQRHNRAVYNHCFRHVGNWSTAEDLTAMVFLEAWRGRKKLRVVNGSALPWLLGMSTNVTRNVQRSQRRLERMHARLGVPRPVSDATDTVDDRVSAQAAYRPLLDALTRLSGGERSVIELCVAGQLSYAEAAEVLHCPVGTVKSRLSRGLGRLRDQGIVLPDKEKST